MARFIRSETETEKENNTTESNTPESNTPEDALSTRRFGRSFKKAIEELKIETIQRTINGHSTKTIYPYKGTDYESLLERFKAQFNKQSDFYEKILGVPYEVSKEASWHPDDSEFFGDIEHRKSLCDGWKKMVMDDGLAVVETTHSFVDVSVFHECFIKKEK